MRHYSLVVAILILLQSLGWSQSGDIPADDVRFDRGTIANGNYTNECFGLLLSIPDGWEVSTTSLLASGKALHLPGGGLGLLILGRHREKGFGDQFALNAIDAGKYPAWTVQSFVSGSVQRAVNSDPQRREIIRDAFAVEYGGRQFYRADYKQSLSNDTTQYAAYAFTKFGEYFVGATLTAASPEVLNEAADSLRRLSFHRDSPNPKCVIGPNDGPLMGVIGTVRSGSSGAAGVLRVRVSRGVSQGLLIKQVQPEYPEVARQGHIEGTVVLQTTIDANGNVEDATLISGPPQLAPAAIVAVKQWKYKPYTLNGQPVKIETQTSVVFQLSPN
jgi:TonB family protein